MIRKSFGRSLSFPTPRAAAVPKLEGRGSTSLPTRFHPFVSALSDHVHRLLTWHHRRSRSPRTRPDSDWILDGLSSLDRLLSSLDDLLQHPRVHDVLRRGSSWTGRLLEDLLRFADVYGSFRSAILSLKDRRMETRTAIRREDRGRIASCVRLQGRTEKEILKISSSASARSVGRWGPAHGDDVEEAELAGVVREAVRVSAAATAAVFAAVVEMSTGEVGSVGVTTSLIRGPCVVVGSVVLRLKGKEGKEREGRECLEEWIGEVERRSEALFRSFVNARVFLLNVLTPSL